MGSFMNSTNWSKIKVRLIYTITLILISTVHLSAESVFLKNGSIIEGRIVTENDKLIILKIKSGKTKEILRKDILRTVYHEKYKDTKYINKTDGTEIKAFIVDEDSEYYIIRIDLNSPHEISIAKDDVSSISKERLVKAEYEPPTGYYLRGLVPGWGQYYSGHYVKGTALGITFFGSAAWMVYSGSKFQKSKDKYDSLTGVNTEGEFADAYDQKKKDYNTFLYSIAATSVIYIINWIDIFFFSNDEPHKSAGLILRDDVLVNVNIYPGNYFSTWSDDGLKADIKASIRF